MVTPISPAEITRVTNGEQIPSLTSEEEFILSKWRDLHITEVAVPLDQIKFLVKTRIANWIACFKNSTTFGTVKHTPYLQTNNEVVIQVEGSWTPIQEILGRVEWDEKRKKIVSKSNPEEVWSYDGIRGLSPSDRFHYTSLQPVYSLSQHELKPLLEHANKFWSTKDEERSCVLQVITTSHTPPSGWLGDNSASASAFEHVTFRLIDKKGQVYSFGVELEEDELDQLSGTLDFFKTATAYLSSPDYEESRRFYKKRVTSLSLTEEQLKGIVRFVSHLNQDGLSFNYLKQNCSTMAREVMHRAGVKELHESSSLFEYLFRWIREIPLIGETVQACVAVVYWVAVALFSVLPDFISAGCRKASTFCIKASLVPCGAISTTKTKPPLECPENTTHLTSFSRLVSSVEDLFDDRVDTHFKLIEWQARQPTTCFYNFQNSMKLYGITPAA